MALTQHVGVLGGAFDPPHNGHVALARGGVAHFKLERLLVGVVARPGHKDVFTPIAQRLALSKLAFAAVPGAEVVVDAHSRTVDSLRALALDDPVFLIGGDEFADFLSWKRPDEVLALARLGVGTRPGTSSDRIDAVLARIERPDRVELFRIDAHELASSDVRRRIAAGGSADGLVPGAVASAIDRLGLYREP